MIQEVSIEALKDPWEYRMIKIVIICLVIYVLYRMLKNDFSHKKQEDAEQEQRDLDAKIAKGEMVKDPECGTYVTKEGGITVRNGNNVYHFCSYECRDKFLNRLNGGQKQIED